MSEEKLKKVLLKNLHNYDQKEVINSFFFISFLNFLIAMAKGHRYQSSWCKKGLFSISQNLERKYSRLDNMMFPEDGDILNIDKLGLGGEEGFLDALSDEANYCNLALTFFLLKGKEDINILKMNNDFIDKQLAFVKDNFDWNKFDREYLNEVIIEGKRFLSELEFALNKQEKIKPINFLYNFKNYIFKKFGGAK